MGMFDEVRCRYPLPRAQDEIFQTKDLNYLVFGDHISGTMSLFEITETGRLRIEKHERKWVEAPEAVLTKGYYKSVKSWWEQVDSVHGDLRIYTNLETGGQEPEWVEYCLRFTHGQLESVVDASENCPDEVATPETSGTYLVVKNETPLYIGKGGPERAHTSQTNKGGSDFIMLAYGITSDEAHRVETAVMRAFEVAGLEVDNEVKGHGNKRLDQSLVLADMTTPKTGPRRTLTGADTGLAIVVPVDLIHSAAGDNRPFATSEERVHFNMTRWWRMDSAKRVLTSELASAGHPVRLIAVVPGATNGIVVKTYLITSVTVDDSGVIFDTEEDPQGPQLTGHFGPFPRQLSIQYISSRGSGATPFIEEAEETLRAVS